MMRMPVFLLALAACAAASADATLSYAVSGAACMDADTRLAIKGSQVRVDSARDGRRGSLVFDGLEEMAYALDHESRTMMPLELDLDRIEYQEDVSHATQAKMRHVGEDLQQARQDAGMGDAQMTPEMQRMMQEQMAAAMKDMPKAEGQAAPAIDPAVMQQMMAGANSGDPMAMARNMAAAMRDELRETGETRTVDGIACRERERLKQQRLVARECVADAAVLGLPEKESRRLAAAIRTFDRFAGSMDMLGVGVAKGAEADDVVVERVCIANDTESGRERLKIDTATVDETLFELPADYRPMMGAQPAG